MIKKNVVSLVAITALVATVGTSSFMRMEKNITEVKAKSTSNISKNTSSTSQKNVKTYLAVQKSKYGNLTMEVKYVIENHVAKIVDIAYDCTIKYMSYQYSEVTPDFAKVVFKDNSGKNLSGARISVSVYADELPLD